jgi:hypothetical protein
VFGKDWGLSQPFHWSVSTEAEFYQSHVSIDAFRKLSDPRSLACIRKVFTFLIATQLPKQKGGTVGRVSVAGVNLANYGGRADGFRLSLPLTYMKRTFLASYDWVVMRKGRVAVSLTFFGFADKFPPDQERAILAAVGRRLAADSGA